MSKTSPSFVRIATNEYVHFENIRSRSAKFIIDSRELPDRDFICEVLWHQANENTPLEIDTIRNWSDEFLLLVVQRWFAKGELARLAKKVSDQFAEAYRDFMDTPSFGKAKSLLLEYADYIVDLYDTIQSIRNIPRMDFSRFFPVVPIPTYNAVVADIFRPYMHNSAFGFHEGIVETVQKLTRDVAAQIGNPIPIVPMGLPVVSPINWVPVPDIVDIRSISSIVQSAAAISSDLTRASYGLIGETPTDIIERTSRQIRDLLGVRFDFKSFFGSIETELVKMVPPFSPELLRPFQLDPESLHRMEVLEAAHDVLTESGYGILVGYISSSAADVFASYTNGNRSGAITKQLVKFTNSDRFLAYMEFAVCSSPQGRSRWEEVRQALRSHNAREYHSSIKGLFPVIEGLVNDCLLKHKLAFNRGRKLSAKLSDGTVKKNKKDKAVDLIGLDSKLSHLKDEGKELEFIEDWVPQKRNRVLHGNQTAYGKSELSIKLIFIVLFLAFELSGGNPRRLM